MQLAAGSETSWSALVEMEMVGMGGVVIRRKDRTESTACGISDIAQETRRNLVVTVPIGQ